MSLPTSDHPQLSAQEATHPSVSLPQAPAGAAPPAPWQRVSSLAGLPPLDPLSAATPPPRLGALPQRAPATRVLEIDRARIARWDRRAFALVVACTLLLLLGATAPLAWAHLAGLPGAATAAQPAFNQANQAQVATATMAGQAAALAQAPAPTETPTTAPTATPAPTHTPKPKPTPTHAPKPTPTPKPAPTQAPPPPTAQAGAISAPSRLALSCSRSTGLTLHNTSGASVTWSLAVPSAVLVNGWSGTVRGTLAPYGTLALPVTERPGTPAGSAQLAVSAQGKQATVALALARC